LIKWFPLFTKKHERQVAAMKNGKKGKRMKKTTLGMLALSRWEVGLLVNFIGKRKVVYCLFCNGW
jgi:hypothetical protein